LDDIRRFQFNKMKRFGNSVSAGISWMIIKTN